MVALVGTLATRSQLLCQCVPLCANRIHFQVAALSSPLGNFRGLKGDKWVSAGYLLPLRPHNTPCHLCCWRLLLPRYCTQAPTSLCCASQVPTISCICIFVFVFVFVFVLHPFLLCNPSAHYFLPQAHCRLILNFHTDSLSDPASIIEFRLHKQCLHSSSCYYPGVDVNKPLSLNRLHSC